MAERTLLSVGFNIPGLSDDFLYFDSDRSLLDADVVLFQPTFSQFKPITTFQGKPSLSESDSATVAEHTQRWKNELSEALKAGKTIFVFLPPLEEVVIDTGKREYSGTGRNQKVLHIVPPEVVESIDDRVRLRAIALVCLDRFKQVRRPSVMEEEDPLTQSP